MRSANLTDDDLWRVIADNTDAMSVLIEKQFELDAEAGAPDPDTNTDGGNGSARSSIRCVRGCSCRANQELFRPARWHSLRGP